MSALPASPNDACGTCGFYRCAVTGLLRCEDPGANACGRCGDVPIEECNGRDDNCDGVIDEGCARRLAAPTRDDAPRVSGNRVVFQAEKRYTNVSEIALVTLPSLDVEILTPHTSPIDPFADPSGETNPAIDGDLVVWTSYEHGQYDLTGYDVATRQSFVIASGLTQHHAVSQGVVAFQRAYGDEKKWESDVWLWDHATMTARVITPSDGVHQNAEPEIDGDWLVYSHGTGPFSSERQVIAENITTGETITVSSAPGWNAQPAISGTRIVWSKHDGGSEWDPVLEIWMYDLSTKLRTKLSTGTHNSMPRIAGTLVCWSDASQIALLDVASGKTRKLSNNDYGSHCDLDARRVVWGNILREVYVRDLLPSEP